MSALEFLHKLPAAFDAAAASSESCTIQFNCSSPVYISIGGGACTVNDGSASDADLTVTMDDDDLIALMKGELNGMTAYLTGKLQVEGDLMLAQRMLSFFDPGKL